jgi:DNA invertase Pin-like site-specific DNA recombinase
VLELARRGLIANVLVWKLDRLGRSTLDVLATTQELEHCGVTLIATSQGLEVGPNAGPMGRLLLRLMAAIAELEREMISERTHLGLAAARRRGVKLGRPRKFVPSSERLVRAEQDEAAAREFSPPGEGDA